LYLERLRLRIEFFAAHHVEPIGQSQRQQQHLKGRANLQTIAGENVGGQDPQIAQMRQGIGQEQH